MRSVVSVTGDFKRVKRLLNVTNSGELQRILSKYGEQGAQALKNSTPIMTGETASSWAYDISYRRSAVRIEWYNVNENRGVNIALILQLGHATGTGGWVEGRDYINPAMRPIFDQMINDLWKEVESI